MPTVHLVDGNFHCWESEKMLGDIEKYRLVQEQREAEGYVKLEHGFATYPSSLIKASP